MYTKLFPLLNKTNWCREHQIKQFRERWPDIFTEERQVIRKSNSEAVEKQRKMPRHLRQKVKHSYVEKTVIPAECAVWFRGYPYQHSRNRDPERNGADEVLNREIPFILSMGAGNHYLPMRIEQNEQWLPEAKLILTQSQSTKEALLPYNNNILAMPNPVNIDLFTPPEEGRNGKLSFGMAGNFSGNNRNVVKGYVAFKEAMVNLDKRRAKVLISNRDRQFHEMPEYYKQIDVLFQTSISEGCSNTVSECMSAGCMPVIVKDIGWHGETCIDIRESDKGNCLFCGNTKEDVYKAMQWCIANKDGVRLAQKNAQETAKAWSWDKLGAEYIKIFKDFLKDIS